MILKYLQNPFVMDNNKNLRILTQYRFFIGVSDGHVRNLKMKIELRLHVSKT
jgi:hypothetical protein